MQGDTCGMFDQHLQTCSGIQHVGCLEVKTFRSFFWQLTENGGAHTVLMWYEMMVLYFLASLASPD